MRMIFTLLLICTFCDARSTQPLSSEKEQQSSVRYVADNIYFQASSVQAIFRDGEHVEYESGSIHHNSTVIGDYLSFIPNGNKKRETRLYFIPPELDWKQNETYHWKLNQAWMADDYYGWLFWNVNGFINSQLQLSSDSELFQCDYVEFTFWNNAPKGRFGGNQGKVIMKNMEVAAFLPTAYEEVSLVRFNPCEGACRVINGKITCRSTRQWMYGATVVTLLVALVIVGIYKSTSADVSTYGRVSSVDATELEDVTSLHDNDDEDSQSDEEND